MTRPWRQEEKHFLVNGLTQAKDVHPENNKLTVQLTLIDNLFIKKKDRNWVSSIAWNVHYLPPAAQSLGERHVSNAWGLGWGQELTDISGYVM